MSLVGKTIGNRYEVLEQVGKGGMATVYKAKDHVLNRNVAIKVLKDEFTTDAEFIKRFNTEAQSAAILTHPNIVSIYDVGYEEETNLYYIVMELIKGKTLKEIINKDGKISWKWAINIAIQMASALEKAHSNEIIHRDIKPHNIIITEDGTAKVTDFGIAKAVSNSTITAFGTTIGSVHYFSPEQAKGGVTDAKSDLYSLGVVMYEMVTGKVPFDADTPVSVALKHMQEEPVAPKKLNKEIPDVINNIILKAMQKDPKDRYQTATEMLSDLSKALKDPNGDFVIIENKDGEYTRVINAVTDDDVKRSKASGKKGLAKFFTLHPGAKIPCFIAGLIALFLVVFLGTRLLTNGFGKDEVDLPNLSNMTIEEVKAKLSEIGFEGELKIGDAEASSTVEESKVLKQDPKYSDGSKIGRRDILTIILSKGPETSELPDFKGKKIEEVRTALEKIGVTIKETEEYNNEIEAGKVVSQDVAAKTLVKSGDIVNVVVSKGKKKTTVPTVVGMDEDTAKATLTNAALKTSISYMSEPTAVDGKVLSQSIEQGKEVEEGAIIELIVNKIEKKNVTLKYTVKIPADNTNTVSDPNAKYTVKMVVDGGNSHTIGDVKNNTEVKFDVESSGKKDVALSIIDKDNKIVQELHQTVNFDGDAIQTYEGK